jgi:cysteine sulfinate desulfinase/cysteine desulfurase-like protein/rhodanese-related sulfurtransferase
MADMIDLYLDANATTPVLPIAQAAAQQMMAANFGNPSSTHSSGLRARAVLDATRALALQVLGAPDGQVFFTSGATEGIQTAVLSALNHLFQQRVAGIPTPGLLLYGATEHKAVPEALKHWNTVLGLHCDICAIPVDASGWHDLAFLRQHAPQAALVCTMAVNNETGVISRLNDIADALGESNALWLVDSVQALGKLPLNLAATRIDYAPFSGHKLYAPKGVGMLYVRPGAPFTPLMVGGGQEGGQRCGTENLPGIAALGAVLQALHSQSELFQTHAVQEQFRERLAESLQQAFPGMVFNMAFANAVCTTLNFSVPGLSSKEMLDLFDAAGIRVSSGSACNSNKVVRSFVLDAMGVENWRATSAVRLSFGPATTHTEIDDACARIRQAGAAIHNACLLFGGGVMEENSQTMANGLIRLVFDSACSWIYADHASGTCVIIDPLPELTERIARWVACRNLQVLAVLATDIAHSPCRAALQQKLQIRIPVGLIDTDDLGWPRTSESLTLPNGRCGQALTLGTNYLVNLPHRAASESAGENECHAWYLLGSGDGRELTAAAVRFAFIGDSLSNPVKRPPLAKLVSPRTLLLAAHDYWQEFATTFESESLPNVNQDDVHLHTQQISEFLNQHPQASVVDVREAYEHGMGLGALNLTATNAPLSRLPQFIPDWLQNEQQDLLFVCRSGARSALAVACLRRLGHSRAWHLAGGLALQETAG